MKKKSHLTPQIKTWIDGVLQSSMPSTKRGQNPASCLSFVWVDRISQLSNKKSALKLPSIVLSRLQEKAGELQSFQIEGQWWLIGHGRPEFKAMLGEDEAHRFGTRVFFRDLMGAVIQFLESQKLQSVRIHLMDEDQEAQLGVAQGLEIAIYRFRRQKSEIPTLEWVSYGQKKQSSEKAPALTVGNLQGRAVNLARHLTNLPANLLNPKTFAQWFVDEFDSKSEFKVTVWQKEELEKERMGLHLAVGRGAEEAPRLVHLSYRPSQSSSAPIAFVGKGITFDSGGLDVKPSAAMRLMKKDMGGSATIAALAWYVSQRKFSQAMDFYFPLAENALDKKSFRPGDIIRSRSGLDIEIHNTDAEGRLVLADALDVAVTQKLKPQIVIDVATLTGAIKIALGAQVAGLFSNQVKLRQSLVKASTLSGEPCWPMPLFQPYRALMQTPVAHMTNAVDGFGGAVTAALFLESFVRKVPWAHFDIYAWKDKPEGAWLEPGGSGQGVLLLAEWLENFIRDL